MCKEKTIKKERIAKLLRITATNFKMYKFFSNFVPRAFLRRGEGVLSEPQDATRAKPGRFHSFDWSKTT